MSKLPNVFGKKAKPASDSEPDAKITAAEGQEDTGAVAVAGPDMNGPQDAAVQVMSQDDARRQAAEESASDRSPPLDHVPSAAEVSGRQVIASRGLKVGPAKTFLVIRLNPNKPATPVAALPDEELAVAWGRAAADYIQSAPSPVSTTAAAAYQAHRDANPYDPPAERSDSYFVIGVPLVSRLPVLAKVPADA